RIAQELGKLCEWEVWIWWRAGRRYDEARSALGPEASPEERDRLWNAYLLDVLKRVAAHHRRFTPWQKAFTLSRTAEVKDHPEGREPYALLSEHKDEEAEKPVGGRWSDGSPARAWR